MDAEWTTEIPEWDEICRQSPEIAEQDARFLEEAEAMLEALPPVWPLGDVPTTIH